MKNMARISSGFKGQRLIVVPPFITNDLKSDELGKELYITDIGYYPRAYFHYYECQGGESFDYLLIYCVDGEGWVTLEGQRYQLKKDQLFILPKNTSYAYGSSNKNPWTIYWMHFNGDKASFFSKGFDKPVDISRNSQSRIRERLDIFEDIYASLNYGYEKNNLLYATTGFFHFLGTIKFLCEYRECNPKEVKNSHIINRAIHYMRENINRKLTLAEIAGYVGLSESYFSGLFVKEAGLSPLRYLTNLRFEEACRYLNSTDMKVNQICPLIGYDDSLYFSRAFTKTMGMSPSEYRANKNKIA